MFKLEASILTLFQEITYLQMCLYLQNKTPLLCLEHHPRVPRNPFVLISTIFTAGKKLANIKITVIEKVGCHVCPLQPWSQTKIEAGGKMVLICLLTSWQLQRGEKEIQSWPIRFVSGLIYVLQTKRKKAGLIMKKENLALQPCARTLPSWLFWNNLLFSWHAPD